MQLVAVVQAIFEIYSFILLARVLLSWFQVDPNNPIVQALYSLTEPVLAPIRRLMPPAGPMDFSPIVAFILIRVAQALAVAILVSIV
jgi:YggT family protein